MMRRMNRHVFAVFIALMVALMLVLSGVAPVITSPGTGVSIGSSGLAVEAVEYCPEPEEAAFLELINQYRAENGLPGLTLSGTLGAAAEHHSIHMAETSFFGHTFADGTSWFQNIADHGYPTNTYTGENIAAGYPDALSVFDAWRNSPGHNANMLSLNFTAIGIGLAYGESSQYGSYWTTTFGGIVDTGTAC